MLLKQLLKFLPVIIALVVAPYLLPPGRAGSYYLTLMILASAFAICSLGLTVLLGYAGQVSLAQAAFFGIGAYSYSILTAHYAQNTWISLIVAIVVTTIFGIILGMIVLRLRTHYLALATIGFQIITTLVLNNWQFTGGADGIVKIPRPSVFGLSLASDRSFYLLSVLILVVASYVVYRLRHSLFGSTLLAIREDEVAAESSGIDVTRAKITAFAVAALLAGVGGSIYAAGTMYISPDVFTFDQSVVFFAMVLIGGQELVVGTILGAFVLTFLPEILRFLDAYYIAAYGVAMVVIILFFPEGLYGLALKKVSALATWRRGDALTEVKGGGHASGVDAPSGAVVADQQNIPGNPDAAVALVITDLHKYFGGTKAVQGVNITVHQGDVTVLIGPNGSGKTTVLNLVTGIYRPTKGGVTFFGKSLAKVRPHVINRLGLARTFQNIRLFPELSVLENVAIGYYPRARVTLVNTLFMTRRARLADRAAYEKAAETLAVLGFLKTNEKAKNLAYGEQRIVEIARAIIGGPKVLLLDEPAAGMNREEKIQLSKSIRKISAMGVTILLIEHDMSFVSQVSTYVYVMDHGQLISEGKARSVLADPAVVRAYLGGGVNHAPA